MLYNLQEIYEIRKNMISYVLPNEIMTKIQAIEKEIGFKFVPDKAANTASSSGAPYHSQNETVKRNSSSSNNNTNNYRSNRGSSSFVGKNASSSAKNSAEDLSWENVRNFKTTKIEKKEGIDKRINDIRICLNKISAKNYDTQKDTIFQHIQECITDSQNEESEDALYQRRFELGRASGATDSNLTGNLVEESNGLPFEFFNGIKKIATAIFDIASTNKFFAEIYAKLYKSLIELYPVFNEVLHTFVENFVNSLQEIKYVDQNEDYDLFCVYNKQNDKRKASAVFLIHMMKIDALSVSTIGEILSNLVAKIEENMEIANHLNEVEEMTEVLFLFLQEGYAFISTTSASSSFSHVFDKIRKFATYKIKEKASLSSRVIFKYMDLVTIMSK